jgi:hypothetical protein
MKNNKELTAVDKAQELIDKMTKQYALIAVNEILTVITECETEYYDNYWQEVKQEIEKYEQQETKTNAFLTLFVLFIFGYLMASFSMWDFNPLNWDKAFRSIFAIWVCCVAMLKFVQFRKLDL